MRGVSRGPSFGPADSSDLPAFATSAKELIAAIRLKPGYTHSRRQLEALDDFSCFRIDPPQFAFVTFPGAVPEFAVDPGDPGDKAIGLDGAKNRACIGIDLVDLPLPVHAHPERSFGPCESRVPAAAGRRDGVEHAAGLWIDLLDAILG